MTDDLAAHLDLEIEGSEARTELAWTRTGLASLGCVALLGRRVALALDDPTAAAITACAIIAVAGIAWSIALAIGARRRAPMSGVRVDPRFLRFVTAGTALLAIAGIAVEFLPEY